MRQAIVPKSRKIQNFVVDIACEIIPWTHIITRISPPAGSLSALAAVRRGTLLSLYLAETTSCRGHTLSASAAAGDSSSEDNVGGSLLFRGRSFRLDGT